MNESEDTHAFHEDETLKIISKDTDAVYNQDAIILETDSLVIKSINKPNEVALHTTKYEEFSSNLEENQITKPGNASYFDLSKHNLKVFPVYLYEHCVYMKFLYLEGNFIKQLDDNFFPYLMNIKWLDIRNNLLESLPKTIANHSNLEVLLLQDNKLKILPLELGLVAKLRGLQVLGNPLEFPPKEVLQKGAKSVIEFLQEEHKIQIPSSTNIRPIDEKFYTGLETKGTEPMSERKFKSKSGNITMKKRYKVEIKRAASANLPSLGIKSYRLNKPELRASKSEIYLEGKKTTPQDCTHEETSFKNLSKSIEKVGKNILQLWPTSISPNCRKSRMEAKIQDVLLQEQLIAKIKELMENQLTIIQRWKDEETLKNWRRNGKFNTMQRDAVGEPPFAVDPDFMGDSNLAAGSKKPAQKQYAIRDVQEEISDIFQSLRKLGDNSKNIGISPRTQQNQLCNEIQTLMHLQKKLQGLKFRNPRQGLPAAVPSLPIRGQKLNIE